MKLSERTPMQALIDALAKRAVADYLTPQPAQVRTEAAKRTERVPLLPADKAA